MPAPGRLGCPIAEPKPGSSDGIHWKLRGFPDGPPTEAAACRAAPLPHAHRQRQGLEHANNFRKSVVTPKCRASSTLRHPRSPPNGQESPILCLNVVRKFCRRRAFRRRLRRLDQERAAGQREGTCVRPSQLRIRVADRRVCVGLNRLDGMSRRIARPRRSARKEDVYADVDKSRNYPGLRWAFPQSNGGGECR
jgi:hypothetical protein